MARKINDGEIMWRGISHMCMDVKGGLRQINKKKFPYEYALLQKADWEGKRVVPVCDCDNFDYEHGCLGHHSLILLHDWAWETGNG